MNEAVASGGARSFTGQPASHRYQLWSLSSASGGLVGLWGNAQNQNKKLVCWDSSSWIVFSHKGCNSFFFF